MPRVSKATAAPAGVSLLEPEDEATGYSVAEEPQEETGEVTTVQTQDDDSDDMSGLGSSHFVGDVYDEAAFAPKSAELYGKLAAPFDNTFKDNRGGVELEYITGEQAISRLNDVLGIEGWSFRIVEHGIHAEADEAWVLAEFTVNRGYGLPTIKQQFGSQKIKRSRNTGTPLDIGFDFKGAATDALKKCASLVGVGLYLSRKEAHRATAGDAAGGTGAGTQRAANRAAATATATPVSTAPVAAGSLTCDVCGEELQETRFRDGTVWTPLQLKGYGTRKHGKTLCMTHYREANDARKRAEQEPF